MASACRPTVDASVPVLMLMNAGTKEGKLLETVLWVLVCVVFVSCDFVFTIFL